MARYFTRDEAEALLSQVEPLLREIQALRASLGEDEEALAALRQKLMSNGHSGPAQVREVQSEVAALGEEIARRIALISDLGILVKDLETGMIDFPALRHGREVYLCWRLGERGIGWWHDVDAGFAGRQPLEE